MGFHRLKYQGIYRSQKPHRPTCGCNKCFKNSVKISKKKLVKEIAYFEYIKSPEWFKRKQEYYRTHKRQCRACGSYKQLNLHHMLYGNFGNEPDNTMVCLCRACHVEFHKIYPATKDLLKQTKLFIECKQEVIHRAKELSNT